MEIHRAISGAALNWRRRERKLRVSAFDPNQYVRGLHKIKSGFWRSQKLGPVDYPTEGHQSCFAVEDNSFWFRQRNKIIAWAFAKFSPATPIFDIGGGNGFVTSHLQQQGWEVVLVEPGGGVENAVARGVPTVLQTPFDGEAFVSNQLPAVGLFDVIEHIEDDLDFLKKMHDCLAPGGLLFVTVPAYQFLWSREDEQAHHHRRYSLRQISRRLESLGFEVCFKTYFFLYLIFPIFLFRTLSFRITGKGRKNAEAAKGDHVTTSSFLRRVIDLWFDFELFIIKRLGGLPFGTSCLVVARKPLQ